MSPRNKAFKKHLGLFGTICASLLIGLPAIAQMNSNPSSTDQTDVVPARTAPENQPNRNSDRLSPPSTNQMGDRDTSETNLDRMCNTSELVGNRQGVRPSDSNMSATDTQSDRTSNSNMSATDTQSDRTSNSNMSAANTQSDRTSNSNMSLAERDPMCTNNMNEPGMNRETPSGTMREDNRQTSPNTRPIPSPSP